jgi:hypothetical protein
MINYGINHASLNLSLDAGRPVLERTYQIHKFLEPQKFAASNQFDYGY